MCKGYQGDFIVFIYDFIFNEKILVKDNKVLFWVVFQKLE